jgi:hypothetical protein
MEKPPLGPFQRYNILWLPHDTSGHGLCNHPMGSSKGFCRRGTKQPQLPLQVYKDKGAHQVIYPKHINTPSSKFYNTCL